MRVYPGWVISRQWPSGLISPGCLVRLTPRNISVFVCALNIFIQKCRGICRNLRVCKSAFKRCSRLSGLVQALEHKRSESR